MRNIDPILTRAHEIGLQQHDAEIKWLLSILDANQPASILEIGVGTGGSNYLWSECYPGNQLVSVDIIDAPSGLRGQYIRGDSHDINTQIEITRCSPFDFAFIDGDHSYEGVKKDFEMCRRMVAPGGIIALHDIVDSEYHRGHGCYVSQLWAELKREYFTREIITSNWGGIGVVVVE